MFSSFAQVSGDDDNYIDDVFLCFHSAGDGYAVSEHEHHDEDEDVVNDSDGDGDVIRVSTLVRIRVVKAALATKANITTQIVRLVITSAV